MDSSPAQPENTTQPPAYGAPAPQTANENPDKSYIAAFILSYLLGSFGIDRFYLGKIGTGILKLITFGGLGIWALVDFILIALGKLTAKDDSRPLDGFHKNVKWGRVVALIITVFTALWLIFGVGMTLLAIPALQDSAEQNQMQLDDSTYQMNSSEPGEGSLSN